MASSNAFMGAMCFHVYSWPVEVVVCAPAN